LAAHIEPIAEFRQSSMRRCYGNYRFDEYSDFVNNDDIEATSADYAMQLGELILQ
jgi:hypothetical protein